MRRRWGKPLYRMRRYRRWGKPGGNLVFDLIKFYIALFAVLSGIVFIIVAIYKPNKHEKKPEETPKKIEINSIKRSTAFKRGLDIINYVWDYNYYKNGEIDNNEIKPPRFLKGIKEAKISGIPYCWGGYLSIDISNIPNVKNFADAIDRGFTAGNVMCRGEYKDFTAGLDCSGFVSAVYNLNEKCSTQSLKYYFDPIDIKDIKPMDIFNSEKNHTFIYIKESWDKKGIVTMEATTNSGDNSRDKTVINYRSYDDINKGINGTQYIPMRFKGVIDDYVETFKDINEYNDNMNHACSIWNNTSVTGYIEYADDVDYFTFESKKNLNIGLSIETLPSFIRVSIVDDKGYEVKSIKDKGLYSIKVERGKYYIKIAGSDFKYSSTEPYKITLKQ